MARFRIISTCAVLLSVFLPVHFPVFAGDDPFRGPWETVLPSHERNGAALVKEKEASLSILQRVAVKGVAFFQDVVSPTDGDRCPLVPSCSTYGMQAVKKHGFAVGTIMIAARLTHEREQVKHSPRIRTETGYRFYDPVESNDFWFSNRPDNQPESD